MNNFYVAIVVLQVISAIAIIALVLLQHGKGADMGAAFGSATSGSLFGASGSANFLSRLTAIAAAIFFVATMGLTYFSSKASTSVDAGVMSGVVLPAKVPVAPIKQVDGQAPTPGPVNQIPK